MIETEIKLRVNDPAEMRIRLKEAGAVHRKTGRNHDSFFDYPDKRLQKKGELMRLRITDQIWPDGKRKAVLTFKGRKTQKGAIKQREETEFETKDLGGALIELHELGLRKQLEYLKVTEFYKMGELKITLDHFPHFRELGYFMELEGTEKQIATGMKKLKLNKKDAEMQAYPEILQRKFEDPK
jgi:predicted adenylyl cyclase CyaB